MSYTLEKFGISSEKTLLFLFILKKDGEIISFNPRCELLFPIEENKIRGKFITDFIIDKDVSVFLNSVSSLCDQNPLINLSLSFPTEKQGVVSIKFDFKLYNNLIYATGIDTTEEYKEHRALLTISKLAKTGAWYFNPKNNEMYWSDGCYQINELSPCTPITREKEISFYPEDTRARIKKFLDNLIKGKETYEYTEKIITEKGNEKWVKVVGQPVIYKDEVVYVNGTITDVTDRYNYIEKLKYSEETKHLALKGIQSGLFDYHVKKNEVFYGSDFKKMLGLPLDKDFVAEEEFRKMIHPDDVEQMLERRFNNFNEDGNYYYNYYRLKHINEGYRHYEVYGFKRKNSKGKIVRMIGNLIDVHQKKTNEKTIAESKNRLQAIVNNGFTYTILLDTEGIILMTDEKSVEIIKRDFNVDPTQVSCRFIDVTPLNFKNSFAHEFNEALKGNIVKKEIERITHKGDLQWLEARYIPIFNQEKRVNSVLVSFLDITERKLAEIAIKESHIKEQELNSLKSNILSNFSHEIRTPLNGIMTISKLLLDEESSEEREKLLKYLEESKKRLLDTINNLSNFSEIEAIKKNINVQESDINYTIETSYREYKHMAEAKELTYQLELDPTSPKVNIDRDLFRAAINNIIHNAIKYTNKGNIIIKVNSKNLKNNVYISVIDTGIGIDKENLKKIFDPFIQESIGMSRKYEGTGIGLSVSKRYIEILNGKIKVKSKIGKGTEFNIIIPKCL
ncbi:PAS domain S-box-containing protein [Aquimarina sp. MAR_2010_214]|uniref:PAS domain-containing sensor histidine kinase n=1 Tax=Aquimarina sp. MAR_2010_214 TaxID=1250026 RepID=UPI000C70E6D6|nr:PAS domain-containing sensor histidine kinase [Aquimarina sp. MAR_2010_214]PKV50537.1 PAS domain S-box-containing protein [Aquimarina sp. MAR_2010_214]